METMGVLVTREEILFDTFGACAGLAVGAGGFLAHDGGKMVGTHDAELGLDHLIFDTFSRFSGHGIFSSMTR
jgi:hypothetical protein